MAEIPGSLLERSHPAPGYRRDPVTQRGIRVKQGIQDDYSASRQMQKSPFLSYLGCCEALPPPLGFPRHPAWQAGWVWRMPRPAASPSPCSQHPLASGWRRAREADEASDTLQWQLRCSQFTARMCLFDVLVRSANACGRRAARLRILYKQEKGL